MTEQILIKKRAHIKAKLTRFINFLNDCNDDEQRRQEILSRLEKVETIWNDFDTVQTELEDLNEAQGEERDTFENKFHETITKARNMIAIVQMPYVDAHRQQRAQLVNQPINIIQQNKLRLPTIEIPKFDGSWEKWLPFRDTFCSMVHDNNNLPLIDKLHYLRWALVGDAYKLIESLEVTNENYSIAWEIVNKRYKGDKAIIQHHVQALINFPGITRESHSSLRQLVDTTQQHIRTLKRLGQPTDSWDTILIQLLISKLDSNTRREWESERANKEELPRMENFTSFLETRCSFLEALSRTSAINISKSTQGHSKQQSGKHLNQMQAHISTENTACPICQNTHKIYECLLFKNMSVQSRIERVKGNKLCYNCLKSFHGKRCTYGTCKKCHKSHNTLLHLDKTADSNAPSTTSEREKSASQNVASPSVEQDNASERNNNDTHKTSNVLSSHYIHGASSYVLLSTAIIYMRDKHENIHECRALLDSGAQPNFLTRKLSEKLKLPLQDTDIKINGITLATSRVEQQAEATIYSRFNNFQVTLPFLIVDDVADKIPPMGINVDSLQIPANIKLADPRFHVPGKIDLLLGSEIFWKLLCVGQIQPSKSQPVFQKTKLGWIIAGRILLSAPSTHPAQCHLACTSTLQKQLEKFWQLEEVQSRHHLTQEEQACEKHFIKTHSRQQDGRFIVQIPLKDNHSELGESYDVAQKRLLAMERKLAKQPELKQPYDDFMREYLELGHMKYLRSSHNSQQPQDNKIAYYMPHHAVVKKGSHTTRLRVVFDASAKTTTGLSLNDVQLIGPTIQQDLFSIVVRFRQYRYAVSADISKMYRQIKIKDEQCRLQRILWRFHPNEEIKVYELQTVTYGEASSAFLAIRSLHQAARDLQQQFPEASEAIIRDFYVDDLLTGSNDVDHLLKIKAEIITVLKSARFELHKWKANHPGLLNKPNHENLAVQLGESEKILGQLWDTQPDVFRYTIEALEHNPRHTKRLVLSIIAQIFDPLGLLGPIIARAKIIMQQLWQIQSNWDETLPTQIHTQWILWYRKLAYLNHLKVPRRILCNEPAHVELHGFCDASEHAYGACIYVRSTDSNQQHHVKLLCAKSRVAPLKTISLPRLELCGALLLAQLYQRVNNALTATIDCVHFWSDSTITLSWIAGSPSQWSTFVANRVSEIQKLTSTGKWHHIRSEHNPADIISRGLNPDEIQNCTLWWKGPTFLQENCNDFQNNPAHLLQLEELPEVKRQAIVLPTTTEEELNVINRFSSLKRLNRVIAYCLRFAHNAKQGNENIKKRYTGPLHCEELEHSMRILLRISQQKAYVEEIKQLTQNKEISRNSKILSLRPFLDTNGLLRVGGRLHNAPLDYSQRHPIILSSDHHLTHLIIREEHLKNLHAGIQTLLAIMRTRYWPVSGKNVIKGVLRKCIVCFRARATTAEQLMGNLPASRVSPLPPFAKSGVDYAGPFTIKISRNKTGKAYLCVFVCFVTKAVHLEIVSDLSTFAFLNALKRFIARRGKCISICSDNGTNFVGANNALKEMYQLIKSSDVKIHEYLSEQAIEWGFIPPQSPHMGGLWESAVKACKNHLTRVVGSTPLTFEELTTIVTQVEAILNSRPLTPLSSDAADFNALTPGHFLIGRPLTSILESDLTDIKVGRINCYQILEQMRQTFWKRWSIEYLTQLQQRTKWKEMKTMITKDTMVILREANVPPMNWRLGRIIKVYPGKDGLVRVVDVKTSTGVYQRPLSKICVLPINP